MANRFVYVPNVTNQSVVKIIPAKVSVHVRPDKTGFSDVVCNLLSGIYIQAHEVQRFPDVNVVWIRANCGWVMIANGSEAPIGEVITDRQEAENSWKLEKEKRQRMASAVASMLIKSYSLPKAIRLSRSIAKHATQFYPDATTMTKVGSQSMEDIMISLGGKIGLTKQQVFEYIKVAASRQSNPRQAVVEIAEDMFNLVTIRPSTWVTKNLNVIITEDIRIRNNKFIMCAAEGYVEGFVGYLQSTSPPELTCLHSDLHYTALHAAAEFGKENILVILIQTGLSLDIRDPVKGQTPLHFCAYAGRSEVASLLLTHGANRQLTCNKGIYPYQAAYQQGHFECSDVLKFPPPAVTIIEITFTAIDTLSIIWQPPILDINHHAPIQRYHIECVYLQGSIDIPDPKPITTSHCHCTFRGLFPSCEYSLRIQTESLAGRSPWSTRLTAKTLPTIPETPFPIEIHKVIVNGLFVKWFAPKRCNGCPIDYYELEIIDAESKAMNTIPLGGAIEEEVNENFFDCLPHLSIATNNADDWDEQEEASPSTKSIGSNSTPGSPSKGSAKLTKRGSQKRLKLLLNSRTNTPMASSSAAKPHNQNNSNNNNQSSLPSTANSNTSNTSGNEMKVSKLYRLLKHNNVNSLQKNILGLEPNRAYQLRIRAHNQMGNTLWSDWCIPVCPRMGIWVKDFVPSDCAIAFTWFQPILSPPLIQTQNRKIDYYELQICRVLGPTVYSRSVAQYHIQHEIHQREEELAKTTMFYSSQKKPTNNHNTNNKPADQDVNEYVTIDAKIINTEYIITGLKPGNRYKCRIRTKVSDEEEYEDWEHGMYSEIISLPPTRPDCPIFVRPQIKKNTSLFASSSNKKKKQESQLEEDDQSLTSSTTTASSTTSSQLEHNIYQTNKKTTIKSIDSIAEENNEPVELTAEELLEQRIAQDMATFLSSSLALEKNDATTKTKTSQEDDDDSDDTQEHNNNSSIQTYVDSTASSFLPPKDRIELQDDLDITHNSIVLTWTNGDANGQPITAYEILCAHVRTYHIGDVIYARDAFLKQSSSSSSSTSQQQTSQQQQLQQTTDSTAFEEEFHAKIYQNTAASASSSNGLQQSLTTTTNNKGSSHLLGESTLEWKDITSIGEFVSPQSFQVKHLMPGQAYAFKVRQANAVGWSEYSSASALISTYPSIPPHKPYLLSVKDTFVILAWEEDVSSNGTQLTTLDYEVQLRTLEATNNKNKNSATVNDEQYSSDWFGLHPVPRQLMHQELTKYTSSLCCAVMIQQLVECQWYIARVRIRTVIGWSPWSESSLSFRTLK